MVSEAPTSLAPGFRFHPTDEELVRYYLRRKIYGKPFRFDAISEIDIYKAEPWDLPGKSRMKTRDLEWYFFSVLDKKYGNGSRTNRATERGYWKTTGKDRPVYHRSQVVGMKKTLVYHSGRAPRGERTNWVMHEYRLIDEDLGKAGIVQDAFVLCRVFQKSGSGPKNGEQYGAPFVEEEWEDNELQFSPKEEAADELEFGEEAYLDENDLEQILGAEISLGEDTAFAGLSTESVLLGSDESSQKVLLGSEEYSCEKEHSSEHFQKLLVDTERYGFGQDQLENRTFFDLPVEDYLDKKKIKHEYIGESSRAVIPEATDNLLGEEYMDATDKLDFNEASFFETNDLSAPINLDSPAFDMLEEYLAFSDANGEMPDYLTFDPPEIDWTKDFSGDASTLQGVKDDQPVPCDEQPEEHYDNASLSKQAPVDYGTGFQYPFIKQASQMLGSIPAPSAFASEFPSKGVALQKNSASHSSSSVHVTAGMIQIRNTSQAGHGTDLFPSKNGFYNITVSFGLSRGEDNSTTLEYVVRIRPEKLAGSWFYLICFSILILSLSFKIGTSICAL